MKKATLMISAILLFSVSIANAKILLKNGYYESYFDGESNIVSYTNQDFEKDLMIIVFSFGDIPKTKTYVRKYSINFGKSYFCDENNNLIIKDWYGYPLPPEMCMEGYQTI